MTEPRPVQTDTMSRFEWLQQTAKWAGVYWHPSSMHATADEAILKAAEYREQIERLRSAALNVVKTGATCGGSLGTAISRLAKAIGF